VQEGINNINQRVDSSQHLAMQNQLALSTALMQITSALSSMQVRLDSLEKQAQTPARLTPCITEMRNLEEACQQVISRAQKERDEMAARAEDIERSHSRIFRTNRSLASHSEHQAQQLADSRSEVTKLRQALQAREEQYNSLKTTTGPLVRQAQAAQAEQRQRERRVQLQQPDLGLLSAVERDGYKIKKVPEATRKWLN
jgi:chromosome segregation ATPase